MLHKKDNKMHLDIVYKKELVNCDELITAREWETSAVVGV